MDTGFCANLKKKTQFRLHLSDWLRLGEDHGETTTPAAIEHFYPEHFYPEQGKLGFNLIWVSPRKKIQHYQYLSGCQKKKCQQGPRRGSMKHHIGGLMI